MKAGVSLLGVFCLIFPSQAGAVITVPAMNQSFLWSVGSAIVGVAAVVLAIGAAARLLRRAG